MSGNEFPFPPAPIPGANRRRSDPLNDADVRVKVRSGEELTSLEKFVRRMYAQKKPIGGFLMGLGGVLLTLSGFYPRQWLAAGAAACGTAGAALMAGGSNTLKSDTYEKLKNDLLKRQGLM